VNCNELLEVLLDYVNGEMLVESRTSVDVHIQACQHCGILVQSYVHTVRVAKALPKCKLSAAFEAKLRAMLEPELKDQTQKPPG
jgi:anti-sigma factor RsiW